VAVVALPLSRENFEPVVSILCDSDQTNAMFLMFGYGNDDYSTHLSLFTVLLRIHIHGLMSFMFLNLVGPCGVKLRLDLSQPSSID
jgi:hypothetical protein